MPFCRWSTFTRSKCRLPADRAEIYITTCCQYIPIPTSLSGLTVIFPGGPGSASARMPPLWTLLELRWWRWWWWQIELTRKAPVKLSPPTNQHPAFTDRRLFLSPNQQCRSTEGEKFITFHVFAHPKLTWGSCNLVFDHLFQYPALQAQKFIIYMDEPYSNTMSGDLRFKLILMIVIHGLTFTKLQRYINHLLTYQ